MFTEASAVRNHFNPEGSTDALTQVRSFFVNIVPAGSKTPEDGYPAYNTAALSDCVAPEEEEIAGAWSRVVLRCALLPPTSLADLQRTLRRLRSSLGLAPSPSQFSEHNGGHSQLSKKTVLGWVWSGRSIGRGSRWRASWRIIYFRPGFIRSIARSMERRVDGQYTRCHRYAD